MTSGELATDPAVLERIADMLRTSGANLAAVGDDAPDMPDAGELSGAIAEMLSNFAEAAAQLVIGLSGAGDLVTQSRAEYVGTDQDSASAFPADVAVG